jgi:hypothetical protein
MKQTIQAARDNGVKYLCSIDFAHNTAMCALAEDLGMSAGRDPSNPWQTIYSREL